MAISEGTLIDITVHSTVFNQRVITSFPYVAITSGTFPGSLGVLKSIADYWQAGAVSPFLSFLACCPQNLNVDFIQAQQVYPLRLRSMRSTFNQPGTDANDATTANVAASIERAGQLSGRKYVGRISIPALAPFNQVDGKILAAFFTKMGTLASKMLNDWQDFTNVDPTLVLRPCLIHREKNPDTQKWFISGHSELYTCIPQDTVRTQRSRNIGKGI